MEGCCYFKGEGRKTDQYVTIVGKISWRLSFEVGKIHSRDKRKCSSFHFLSSPDV